ncbi:MAG: hypothetical protein QM296_07015, partial [Bacillota bacterium]|nr:hypothetical protein [Bacillota bacterium]
GAPTQFLSTVAKNRGLCMVSRAQTAFFGQLWSSFPVPAPIPGHQRNYCPPFSGHYSMGRRTTDSYRFVGRRFEKLKKAAVLHRPVGVNGEEQVFLFLPTPGHQRIFYLPLNYFFDIVRSVNCWAISSLSNSESGCSI